MKMLPGIVRMILRSAAVGALLGVLVLAGFLATDVGGIRSMVQATSDPIAPLLLLGIGFASLIGSVYVGTEIMLLSTDERADVWRDLDTSKG
jgi:hypothetical protein